MYRAYDRDWETSFDSKTPDFSGIAEPDRPTPAARDCRAVVHPLVFCPPLPKGTHYLLVRRSWPGQRSVVKSGRATSPHPSLNLARVRRSAALLGATEVHVLPAR